MRATGGEGLPLASRGWDPQHSNKDVRVGDQGGHRAVMMGRAPTAYTIMLLRKVLEQASCKRGLRSQKKWGPGCGRRMTGRSVTWCVGRGISEGCGPGCQHHEATELRSRHGRMQTLTDGHGLVVGHGG